MFSFSTSWNAKRQNSAESLIEEIQRLGFDSIELNFTLTAPLVEGIYPLVEKGLIKVVSLHNYCPMPKGLTKDEASPDLFSISSLDKEERLLGIEQTKCTIDTAYKLGAKAVVVHSGKVEMEHSGKELKELYLKNQQPAKEYETFKQVLVRERNQKSKAHLKAALSSLENLSQYAQRYSISLGIETRYYLNEIPSFDEVGIILKYFSGSNLFYWHDVGHAYVHEKMGIAKSLDYLNAYGGRMLGIHIHDVKGIEDHKAPLTGDVDFKAFTPFLNNNGVIKVIEVHSHASAEEIVKGTKYLESLYGEEGRRNLERGG